ncbi:serine/threonine-protein kinase [Sandaracinus amylolyticus]|uniref:serine/threonine-protein kinase n=1 Tax=Sandaracinus amylolyticus TaxID=927083 RepID=UPI0014704E64|nr:serine/threonine-protein kinase [Sandaracinus amylolyticus]
MPSLALPTTGLLDEVGPYRVLARLAAGGMSEILLARRAGVAGLERLVVLKRMRPDLVSEPELRDALLDEARIMLGLRHPNVVAVQELACEGDELYLVMEHLRGDNLLALMRAVRAHRSEIDLALAVHVAADVCAGLHAAHELVDDDGAPLHVIHRDVSPQNVFVTFDGEVKLIDFGIARFADRVARTKSGVVKGKFAYMAPEQFSGEPLDRRTDVFAAGVVLHELLTGKRLFARTSDRDMLMAILSDPVPRPSALAQARGIPPALDEICMRALARDRGDRFATAGEMRAALREQLPALDPRLDPRETLSRLTKQVLAPRLAEVDALLRRARRPGPEKVDRKPAPISEPPPRLDPPSVPLELDVAVEERAPEPRHGTRALAFALGAGAGVALAGLALSVLMRAAIPPPAPRTDAAPIESSAPPPVPSPAPIVEPPVPATIRVRIESTPSGATVRIAGEARGVTPLAIELPRGTTPIELALELRGHTTITQTLVPDESQRLLLQLAPRPPRRAPVAPTPTTP